MVERFRAENFEPAGYTLLSYGAVQAWAQALKEAGSLEVREGDCFIARPLDLILYLGRIDFDDKGDLTVQSWVWYIWKGGEYVPLE